MKRTGQKLKYMEWKLQQTLVDSTIFMQKDHEFKRIFSTIVTGSIKIYLAFGNSFWLAMRKARIQSLRSSSDDADIR